MQQSALCVQVNISFISYWPCAAMPLVPEKMMEDRATLKGHKSTWSTFNNIAKISKLVNSGHENLIFRNLTLPSNKSSNTCFFDFSAEKTDIKGINPWLKTLEKSVRFFLADFITKVYSE